MPSKQKRRTVVAIPTLHIGSLPIFSPTASLIISYFLCLCLSFCVSAACYCLSATIKTPVTQRKLANY